MTFKDFWQSNKDRYLEIAVLNIKLALNCAAEDAYSAGWDAGSEYLQQENRRTKDGET